MSGYFDRIQGKDRLIRIRRIRKILIAGIAGLTCVLIAFRMQGEGASLKPLFLPINGLFEVALIMGLFATIVGLYLRNLEINNVTRDNQRYIMAKYSMTRSLRTAIAAIAIAAVLLLAITPGVAASLFAEPPQVVSLQPNGSETVTFTSPDPFGLTFVRSAVVTVTAGGASVALMKNNVNQTIEWLNASGRPVTLDVEPVMWASLANWSLVFRNQVNASTYLTFTLRKGVVPTLFSSVPFLLLLYSMGHVGWYVGLRPVRERTKAASLYAPAEVDSGERIYEEAMPMPAPKARMAFNFGAQAPPPPPSTPAPPPPPAVAPAWAATAIQTPKREPHRPAPKPAGRTPDTPESFTTKASALVAAGAHDAALTAYDEALRLDPGYVPALRGKAECSAVAGRRTEAIDLYRRALAADRRNLDALRGLARLFSEERRWRECLESVDDILGLRPNEAWALEMKGDALTNLGRRPEALAAYEAATAMDPSNANVRQKIEEVRVDVPGLLSRALIGSASGNYGKALSLFDDILEVEPSNVNALIGKAVAYRRSGKPQEALNCLDLVLGVQPSNAAALLNCGNILLEEGDMEGALDAFDRLTTLYPNDEEAWAGQGDVLVKMGRDDDALRAYTEALKLSPGDEGIQRHILELEAAKAFEADIFQELYKVKGIGKARAKALLDAGFKTAEDFARASVDDLIAVKGITRKIAEDLAKHFRGILADAPAR